MQKYIHDIRMLINHQTHRNDVSKYMIETPPIIFIRDKFFFAKLHKKVEIVKKIIAQLQNCIIKDKYYDLNSEFFPHIDHFPIAFSFLGSKTIEMTNSSLFL